jgi:hypothetical protein
MNHERNAARRREMEREDRPRSTPTRFQNPTPKILPASKSAGRKEEEVSRESKHSHPKQICACPLPPAGHSPQPAGRLV